MVALATVLIFCGKLAPPAAPKGALIEAGGGASSVMGTSLSVASSVDSHLRTGGFSFADLTDATMPSDSDLNLTFDFCNVSFSTSVSEMSDMFGLEMGLTMSRVSRLVIFVSFLSEEEAGGGGETEESELTLTKVEEGDSSRRFWSSLSTSGRLNFFTSAVEGLVVGPVDLEDFFTGVPLLFLTQLPMLTRSLVEALLTRALARSLVLALVTREWLVTELVVLTLGRSLVVLILGLSLLVLTLGLSLVVLLTEDLVARPLVTLLLVGRAMGLDWLFCVAPLGVFSKGLEGNTVLLEELIFLLLDVCVCGMMGPVADFCSFSRADLALATIPVLIEPDFTF